MNDLRIGLIDSSEIVRSGRSLLVSSQPDMRVSFEESDPVRAIELAPDYLVDVIVVGPSNSQLRGSRFLRSLCLALNDAGNEGVVIAYGPFTTDSLRHEAIYSGAQEFVGLDLPGSELLKAIRQSTAKDFLVNPLTLRMLGEQFGFIAPPSALEQKLSELTGVQTKMVELFLTGAADASVAKQLETARTRVTQIIEMLRIAGGFTSRNQLALSLLGDRQ